VSDHNPWLLSFMEDTPTDLKAIAAIFFLAAVYLLVLGIVMLVSPGTVSMVQGTFLLNGLEVAGPYMFLLAGGVGVLTAWGLLKQNRWARRAGAIIAVLGVVMLVPAVSTAVAEVRFNRLVSSGAGVIVRVVIAWYLYSR
jgi:hypothetical protein